jgi:hypothetical protein
MTEFQIYCNHGVLGAEKRNMYTYSNQHAYAVCSDKISVRLPENDVFSLYETVNGELAVETSWGWQYPVDEVLQGDVKPCFCAVDKNGKTHRVYLDVV